METFLSIVGSNENAGEEEEETPARVKCLHLVHFSSALGFLLPRRLSTLVDPFPLVSCLSSVVWICIVPDVASAVIVSEIVSSSSCVCVLVCRVDGG